MAVLLSLVNWQAEQVLGVTNGSPRVIVALTSGTSSCDPLHMPAEIGEVCRIRQPE